MITDDFQEKDKQFHTRKSFERFCRNWDRTDWPVLGKMLDKEFSGEFDWRAESGWEDEFLHSGRNFVFISMGFECNTFIPFETLQVPDKSDPTGMQQPCFCRTLLNSFSN